MKRVILITVVATLTAVSVLAILFGGWWRVHNYVDPVEQARKNSAYMQEQARADMEVLQGRMRQLDLNAFERKHGRAARLELDAEETRQPQDAGYAPECEESVSAGETSEATSARFKRESKCRMDRLEREYAKLKR